MKARRLTFQLTPLLDLLLIVIFAQFLEVRDTTAAQEQQSTETMVRVEQDFDDAQNELTQLRAEQKRVEAELRQLKQELTELHGAAEAFSDSEADLKRKLADVSAQRDQVAKLLGEVFELRSEDLAALFPLQNDLTEEELEELRARIRELSRQDPRSAVRHAVTFSELSKRCDIWEVYVQDNGQTRFTAGDRVQTFAAEDADEFENMMFNCYKKLEQPKSLVLLLLSYGDVRRSVHKAAIDGLPLAADRMRRDQGFGARFEYAVLGFAPEQPAVE